MPGAAGGTGAEALRTTHAARPSSQPTRTQQLQVAHCLCESVYVSYSVKCPSRGLYDNRIETHISLLTSLLQRQGACGRRHPARAAPLLTTAALAAVPRHLPASLWLEEDESEEET